MQESGPTASRRPDSAQQRRPRARKGEGPRLREEIMEATEGLLLRTGSAEAVSIRAVADAVGVTPPSIYRHFADKDTLIAQVCARHFATLEAEMRAAVEGIDDPVDRLVARGMAYIRFGVANPEPYRILFMTKLKAIPTEVQQDWFAHSPAFNETMANAQACIDVGALRPEHDDAYQVALGVWARVHGITSLAITKPFLGLESDEFIASYAEDCLRGIAAR